MKISVPLEDGMLPDRFGKFAPDDCKIDGHPNVSFPIEIEDVPEGTKSIALDFVDYDAIPVGGFCWIHWLACDIAPDTTLIPENASAEESIDMVQGSNSAWSPMLGRPNDPKLTKRYTGPYPPDKTHEYTLKVYALDKKLDLEEGFYLNELRKAMKGHVIERAELEIPSRAS